jgi:hypothetical protein
MTQKLVPGGAFWMDGLCVPEQRETRKRAIGLMGNAYRDAAAVLVIDAGIRSCSFDAPEEERLLRVLTSAWMQRMWTLQEALLTRKLVFEFSDKPATLDDLIPSRENLLDVFKAQLAAEIFRLSTRQGYQQSPKGFGIGHVARSLRWRTTSRVEDETLAISSLLNVDTLELVRLPPEQRMMTLLLRVRHLPSNILFLSGPKLEEPFFRWAPRSLMIREGNQLGITEYNAVCTPEGLIARYICIFFDKTTFDRGERWFLQDKSSERFYSVMDIEAETGTASTPIKKYTCSAVLFQFQPTALEIGAAVLMENLGLGHTEKEEGQSCEYKRRLIIACIGVDEVATIGARRIVDVHSTGSTKVRLS